VVWTRAKPRKLRMRWIEVLFDAPTTPSDDWHIVCRQALRCISARGRRFADGGFSAVARVNFLGKRDEGP
jgi:hypothetical protein